MVLESADRDLVVNAFRSGARGLFCFSGSQSHCARNRSLPGWLRELSNRGIAQELAAREQAVKKHLFRIFEKLGIATPEEIEVAYQEMLGCKVGRVKPRKQSHKISAQKKLCASAEAALLEIRFPLQSVRRRDGPVIVDPGLPGVCARKGILSHRGKHDPGDRRGRIYWLKFHPALDGAGKRPSRKPG
jgi:hypothetical protein